MIDKMEDVNETSKKSRPPPNYFSRRQQIRLLLLVMSFGLVIVLIGEARDPANWVWLTGEQDATVQKESVGEVDIDTSYHPPPPQSDPGDTIRIVPNFDPLENELARFFPGVEPAYLAEVRDRAPLTHQKAWFNLLDVLNSNDSEVINKSSTGPITFGQLYEQPTVYRGHLVTMRGSVKRSQWIDNTKNTNDIDGIYRFIVRPENGPERPVVLFTLNSPEGFPLDKMIEKQDIEFTGFFYKVWNYQADNGRSYLAPVILARDITWTPVVKQASHPSMSVIIGLGVGLVGMAVWFTYSVYRSSRHLFIASHKMAFQPSADDLARLDEVESGPSIVDQLNDLAARD